MKDILKYDKSLNKKIFILYFIRPIQANWLYQMALFSKIVANKDTNKDVFG